MAMTIIAETIIVKTTIVKMIIVVKTSVLDQLNTGTTLEGMAIWDRSGDKRFATAPPRVIFEDFRGGVKFRYFEVQSFFSF